MRQYYINDRKVTEEYFAEAVLDAAREQATFELNQKLFEVEEFCFCAEEVNFVYGLLGILSEPHNTYIYRNNQEKLFLLHDLDEAEVMIPINEELFGFIKPGDSCDLNDLAAFIEEEEWSLF